MLHVTHILCLDAPSSAASAQALPLARRLDATLHVLPHPSFGEPREEEDRGEGPMLTEDATSVPLVRPTDPPTSEEGILQYVADEAIDLVVTDTPPDRGPVPPLAADATGMFVRRLPCPVFVVGQEERPAALQDVLVPTDLSDPALGAFRHGVRLARLYDAAVHVLHVVESPPYVALTPTDRLSLGPHSLSEHRGRRRMKAFLREAEAAGVPLHPHLAYGDPVDQILRFIDRTDVGLLVLSSHGTGGASTTALGQVTTRLLGRTTRPLFLVRTFGASLLASSAKGEDDPAPG